MIKLQDTYLLPQKKKLLEGKHYSSFPSEFKKFNPE